MTDVQRSQTAWAAKNRRLVRVGLTDLLADRLRFIDLSDAEPPSFRRLTIRRHHSFLVRLQTPPTFNSPDGVLRFSCCVVVPGSNGEFADDRATVCCLIAQSIAQTL